MWDDLTEASILVLVGMAVVFAALAILMVFIMILNRLAPEKAPKVVAEEPLPEVQASEKERVAVVAVALAKAMERGEAMSNRLTGLGGEAVRSTEASRWAVSGREQTMRSRGKAGRQWGRRSD